MHAVWVDAVRSWDIKILTLLLFLTMMIVCITMLLLKLKKKRCSLFCHHCHYVTTTMCDHLWASPKLPVMIYWDWKARAMIGNICQSSKRFYRPRPNFLSSNRSVKRLCKKQAVAIGGNHHRGGHLPSLYRYWTSLLFLFFCICISLFLYLYMYLYL